MCIYVGCLCRYQGYIGAALVLGGVDCNGPHLYSIYPHGSTDKLPYVTMGTARLHSYTHCAGGPTVAFRLDVRTTLHWSSSSTRRFLKTT